MAEQDASFPLPQLTVRQLVAATLVVAFVVLGFWLLFRFYEVVLILVAAVILSTAIRPIVTRLRGLGVPSGASVLLVYALLLALLAVFLRFGAPLITQQISTISDTLTQGYGSFRQSVAESSNPLMGLLDAALPETGEGIPIEELPLAEDGSPVTDSTIEVPVVGTTGGIEAAIGNALRSGLGVLAIFILAYYWTLESERMKRSFYLVLPARQRDSARELVGAIEGRISSYVTGQLILCLIIGVLAFIAYLVIGLPYALVLALFAGMMEAVPLVGPSLGAIPALIVAFSISPTTAIWVVVATAVIQQAENNLLVPRVMKQTLGIRPLVTLLSLIAFGTLFGIIGALVALPLAAVLQLLLERSLLSSEIEHDDSGSRDRASLLRYETQELVKDVRNLVRTKEDVATAIRDQVEDSIEAIALDLDSLFAKQNGKGSSSE